MVRRFTNKGVLLQRLLRGCAVAAGLAFAAVGQTQHLVQAVVEGLSDPVVAREASLLLQQQPGVLMARFDVRTRNMMLHVSPDSPLDAPLVNATLAPLGIMVRCYTRRDTRDGRFQHLDPERCGLQPHFTR